MLKNSYYNQKMIEQDDSEISRNENNLLPEVIRSEVNMLVLPFFALWDKELKKKTKTEYKAIAKRDNRKLEISWTVLSNARNSDIPDHLTERFIKLLNRL